MPPHADIALAERCRGGAPGAPQAFEELYRAQAPRLYGLACRFVGRAQAEDLLQEIFLTAYRKLGQYRGDSSLGTWLFRLATNVCVDHVRSKGARAAEMTETLAAEPEARGSFGGSTIDRLDLERALAQLPDGCRTVFVLHDVHGLEHREIGERLGIADGTSKSQLHKARMRLRSMLSAVARS